MTGKVRKRILILGGYGRLGQAVASQLLSETDCGIVVCGRDAGTAEAVAGRLGEAAPGREITSASADAHDVEGLTAVLEGVDLLVVCTTECGSGRGVLEAALKAGVDCVDLRYPQSLVGEALEMREDIERAGSCFFTQAGHLPGLASVLLRVTAKSGGTCGTELATIIRPEGLGSRGAAEEIVGIIRDMKREVFRRGEWRKVGLGALKKIDFGAPFGRVTCIPVRLAELDGLPGRLGLEDVVMYVAGGNAVVDMLVAPLIMLSRGIGGRALTRKLARLLIWGVNAHGGPPFGAVFQAVVADGADESVKARLCSDDSYRFAAAAAVAGILQYLDGTIAKPGLWFMGHKVEPRRILADMERMGVKVKTREDAR